MAREKKEERKHARILYVEHGFNQKEVAAKVKVSLKTINEWCKEDKWDDLRNSFTVTRMEQIKFFQAQVSLIKKLVEDKGIAEGQPAVLTAAQTDQVLKLVKSINALETEANASEVIQAVMKFISFIKGVDLPLSQKCAELADSFLKSIVK